MPDLYIILFGLLCFAAGYVARGPSRAHDDGAPEPNDTSTAPSRIIFTEMAYDEHGTELGYRRYRKTPEGRVET